MEPKGPLPGVAFCKYTNKDEHFVPAARCESSMPCGLDEVSKSSYRAFKPSQSLRRQVRDFGGLGTCREHLSCIVGRVREGKAY